MNKDNNVYKLIKKIFPYLFIVNMFFVWGITFIFIYERFNNILGYILGIISIAISVYSHVIAEDYLEKKYNNKDDQN